MDRFTHPTEQLCCGIVCSSYYSSRLLGFGAVKMKQRLCGTICQAAEAKDSWSNMVAFPVWRECKKNGAGEVGGPAQTRTGCFCFCPNISAVLLHFWKLMSECFCTSQMKKEFIFSSKTKTKTQSKTLQQLFFNANACLFHALKPFSPGCLWQTFHNRLFKVWHMCQC